MYNDQLRIDERMRLRFITEIIEPLGMEPRPVRLQRFQILQLEIQKVVGQDIVFSTPRGGDLKHKVSGDLRRGGGVAW